MPRVVRCAPEDALNPRLMLIAALVACGSNEPEVVDEPAPGASVLTVDIPTPGAWVAAGPLNVSGLAQNVFDMTIDGTPVPSGSFTSTVNVEPGIHVIDVRGKDGEGNDIFDRRSVMVGEFSSPEVAVEDAVRLGVSQEGVDQIVGLAGALIDVSTIESDLIAGNPVVAGSASIFDYQVDLTALQLETPEVEVALDDGFVAIDLSVANFFVDVDLFGGIGSVGLDTSANATVDSINASALVYLSAAGGDLVVDVAPIVVELDNFQFDASLIPFGFDDQIPILSDAVRGLVIDTINDQVNALVPTLVSDIVGGLDPSFELEILERTVAASATFSEVVVTPGQLELGADLDVRVRGERRDKPFAGYLRSPSSPHVLPDDRPFAISIHDDLVNRLLFEIWNADVLALSLSTEDGSLPAEALSLAKADAGTVTVDAKLPPVATEANGMLSLQAGELDVMLDTPTGELGSRLSMRAALSATLQPEVVDGTVGVTIGEPSLGVMVTDSDWGDDLANIVQLLESPVPVTLAMAAVTDLAVPLPTFGGVGIDDATVGRTPQHTTMSMSLSTN